jgi:membrane protein insertase Oxa1/YidC/SpoIIIJ
MRPRSSLIIHPPHIARAPQSDSPLHLSPLTPPTTSDSQSQAAMMNRQMQVMMPLMMMFFTLQYSTGLSIYFIVSSLIRMAQYYFVRRDQESAKANS